MAARPTVLLTGSWSTWTEARPGARPEGWRSAATGRPAPGWVVVDGRRLFQFPGVGLVHQRPPERPRPDPLGGQASRADCPNGCCRRDLRAEWRSGLSRLCLRCLTATSDYLRAVTAILRPVFRPDPQPAALPAPTRAATLALPAPTNHSATTAPEGERDRARLTATALRGGLGTLPSPKGSGSVAVPERFAHLLTGLK